MSPCVCPGSGMKPLSLTTSQDRRLAQMGDLLHLFEARETGGLVLPPKPPVTEEPSAASTGKRGSVAQPRQQKLTDAEELAAALDTRSDAAKARTAKESDSRTRSQKRRDARAAMMASGAMAGTPAPVDTPAIVLQDSSTVNGTTVPQLSMPSTMSDIRPTSPPALVTDGKRRNVTSRNVAFSDSKKLLTPVPSTSDAAAAAGAGDPGSTDKATVSTDLPSSPGGSQQYIPGMSL